MFVLFFFSILFPSFNMDTLKVNYFISPLKIIHAGVPVVAQWLTNPTRNHEVAGSVPALAQWVNHPALPELWCRLQMRLGSRVAVALA